MEITKIDDRVGRYALDGAEQILQPIGPGAAVAPPKIGDGGDVLNEVAEVTSADSLVSGSSHKRTKWLVR